ncbi:OmpA family protein [Maribacter sp. 2-571]|uniref:OmpA family protein n=1 Tax=Maribacter sp. 2-571 TaxID=3417569 RepID=UPI003D331DB5
MSRKNIYIYFILFVTTFASAQVSKADRLFKKGDFLNAAELYEKAVVKTRTQHILEQLSSCYYNTYQYEKGIESLKALVNEDFTQPKGTMEARYHFMYYQLLSATGDYEKAIDQLVVYKNKMGMQAPNVSESKEKVETFRLKKSDFEIKRVGFNSDASDFGAVKRNDSIYFSSDREGGTSKKEYKWTHRPFLDLYVIASDTTNEGIGEPVAMPENINSALHEGSVCFSKDGNTLYLSRSNLVDGKRIFNEEDKNQVQLYVSKKTGAKWSEPKKLPFCSDDYNYQHPSLSADGATLFFATDASGGLGSHDIYRVAISEDGSYGEPENLGATVNTPEREQYPYVSEDGHLFFASNGHLGLGLLDLFVSEYKDGVFQEPINLGAPLNSRYDDISLSYNSPKDGFFSSNREANNDDIFAFTQIGEIFTREYVNIIALKDSITGGPIPNAKVILRNKDGEVVYENTLDEEGTFTANLIPGEYDLVIEALGFEKTQQQLTITNKNNDEHNISIKKLFDIAEITKNDSEDSKEVLSNLLRDHTPPRVKNKDGKFYFDLPYIFFDFDRWAIREDSKVLLNNLVTKLKAYPSLKIRINSHTDNRGSNMYNQVLSEKRAQATRDYLVKVGGLASDRISFKGYGEKQPLSDCQDDCSEEQHQKNRRSQFEIVEY